MGLVFGFLLLLFGQCLPAEQVENEFTEIYKRGEWVKNNRGKGRSGSGSSLEATAQYRALLQDLLRDFNIRSVVDVGCGDWEFSRAVNWESVNYIGYDVVKSVIEKNRALFGKPHISFVHGDGVRADLPGADLLICKEVLQHLPNEDIKLLINQFHKFKYCLITNDVDPVTLTSQNPDIPYGHYRPIDLTKPPFSVKGYRLLRYTLDHGAYKETKEVLFI